MTRREFARNTIGALFGVSALPAAFEKPKEWPPILSTAPVFRDPHKLESWSKMIKDQIGATATRNPYADFA